jgi:large subunit ribosomal protein L24
MEKKTTATHKIKIRKGDLVRVIAGNSKGTEGKVLEVLTDKNRAIVEGANIVKKHAKPSAKNPNGGIIEQEAGIHISNLALIDPKTGKPTRVGRKVVEADGVKKIVRFAKKSGEEIK